MTRCTGRPGAWPPGRTELCLTPGQAGWSYAGLRVLRLPAGGWHELNTGDEEMLVLPLAGSATVDCAGQRFELAGRPAVFAGRHRLRLPAAGRRGPDRQRARRAVRAAQRLLPAAGAATPGRQARYGAAAGVPVELRGAGSCSRQVNGFCMPGTFAASRLLACEVLTPAGNWSSYPPHKHDQDRPGETVLEEIYYFEIAAGPPDPAGARRGRASGFQRVYGTADRPVDLLAEVRTGDVVLIPHGWHGPSMAAPGYDMYYLNVMAGPGPERAWLICDDPAHAWVRESWAGQRPDPRLPFGGPGDGMTRRTVAQAVVRFLAAQYSERDGVQQRLFAGCFGIFGHGNLAGLGQALLEADWPAGLRAGPALRAWPATSRPWCTPRPGTRGCATGWPPGPARPRSAPARPTWSPGRRWPPSTGCRCCCCRATCSPPGRPGPVLQELEHPAG